MHSFTIPTQGLSTKTTKFDFWALCKFKLLVKATARFFLSLKESFECAEEYTYRLGS